MVFLDVREDKVNNGLRDGFVRVCWGCLFNLMG